MKGKEWEAISSSAKDLVKKMLEFDPDTRCSSAQALAHEWIQKYGAEHVDPELTKTVLNEVRHFGARHKLQQAALTYMASQLTTKSEKESLGAIFLSLDKNGKGKLSEQDLLEGYKKMYGDLAIDEEEIKKLMEMIDTDKCGYVKYTEFIVAAISKKTLLSKERLEAAFHLFDIDGSGKISLEEVKEILAGNEGIANDKWDNVIKEINGGKTTEITLEGFVTMMQKLLSD